MADPIKISEQNRALSCDEYDRNLDILQNRQNHVGTQSCDTLNDFEECLSDSATVENLEDLITNNQNRIVGLEEAVQVGGSITTSLSNLETKLQIEINKNKDANENTQSELDDLQIEVSSNGGAIQAQRNYIDQQDEATRFRVSDLEQTVDSHGTRLDGLNSQLSTLSTNLITESGERSTQYTELTGRIDAEISNRASGDSNLQNSLNQSVNTLNSTINTKHNEAVSAVVDLAGHVNEETSQRQAKDNDLQLQINTLNASLSGAVPTGTVLAYAGTSAPAGYLLCNGQSVSQSTYSNLFNLISTRYGSDNSTTFKVPNLQSRVVYGAHTTNLNSIDPYYGENEINLAESQLPKHKHAYHVPGHSHKFNIRHRHGIFPQPHTHTIGNLPDHTHTLAPYRPVALGGGDRGTGAELTAVERAGIGNANTGSVNGTVPGPTIGSTTIKMPTPGEDPNITATDYAYNDDLTTKENGDYITSTGETGGTTTVNIRQASVRLNYIIKT